MKRRIQFGMLAALAATLLAMPPTAASAQMFGQQTPSWRGVWNPVVGTGGTYELTQKDGTKMQMEMAIVGKETVNGKDGYWFELTMDNAKMGGTMIIKNLTVRDNQNMMSQRVIMQMPNRPPMEMPERMIQMRQQNQTQPADIRDQAEVVGPESLTTPAGTFATIHYRMKDGSGDVWVAEHAGPYGMVKYQGKDSSMVLIKVESDAKYKITQTPVPFSPAAFGQR